MTLAIYRASVRLALRSFWVWGVTLTMLVPIFALTNKCAGIACVGEAFHTPFIVPFFLGQMIATVAFAQLERAQRAEETLEALPYRSGPAVIGRVAGLYTVWLGAGTVLYLFAVFMSVLRHGIAPDLFLLVDWLLVMPLTLLFTTGVAFAIGSRMRRGFGAHLAVLLLVLAFCFPFNQTVSQIAIYMVGTGPLTNTDFTLTSFFPITGLPIFPEPWPLLANRIFTVGAGVAVTSLLIWRMARRRSEGGLRQARITFVTGLTAVLLSSALARAYWAPAIDTMMEESDAIVSLDRERLDGVPAPTLGGYDIALTFTTGDSYMNAEADIEITATGEIATFSLNRMLHVRDVTGPDGAPIPYARHGDLLLLTTDGRPGTYHVTYFGQILQARLEPEGGIAFAAHITQRSIVLQEGMGWYPVPGRQSLVTRRQGSNAEVGIGHQPVPMRLTIKGADELHFVSNALEGKPVSRAWLIGTPLAPMEEGGLRFYAAPDAVGEIRHFVEVYGDQLAWYERLVPLAARPPFVEVPLSLWALRIKWETAGFPGAIVVSPTLLRNQDNMVVTTQLLSPWWSNYRTAEEGEVHDILRLFMAELYQKEVRGNDRAYVSLGRMGARRGTETEEGKQLLSDLRAYYAANGLDGAGQVLRRLYDSPLPLSYAAVAEAMQP